MYEKKCAICGRTDDLNVLEIEYEPGDTYAKYVCHGCWDIIAAIAQRAAKEKIKREPEGMYAEYLYRYFPEKYEQIYGKEGY